jgi:hypothetical protein|tara:strand:- start:2104 stop:2256 length:153 start_codon:yes stop_codon:yes gene_type:complete
MRSRSASFERGVLWLVVTPEEIPKLILMKDFIDEKVFQQIVKAVGYEGRN